MFIKVYTLKYAKECDAHIRLLVDVKYRALTVDKQKNWKNE